MVDQNTFSQVQRLLVDEGFINSDDIDKAISMRQYDMELAKLPLALILVKKKHLTSENINTILARPEIQASMKEYIKQKGWLDKQQIEAGPKTPQKNGSSLSYLVDDGLLEKDQFNETIREQLEKPSFIKFAIQYKKINSEDISNVLKIKRYNKSISEILYDLKLVTLTELNHVYRKKFKSVRIGTILINEDLISQEKLDEALDKQKNSSLSLGQILINKKHIALEQLYFALSIQYNTPFQQLKGFIFNEKQEIELRNIVGQRYAEENLLLPLFLNENNLTLGVSNPSNIIRMHELMPIHPQLKMNCILITDEKFEQLFSILYREVINTERVLDVFNIDDVPADRKFVVTAPESQAWLIYNLFERYKKLGGIIKDNQHESGSQLFTEFIIESYNYISKEFNCTSVSFWFKLSNNNIEIMAAPNN